MEKKTLGILGGIIILVIVLIAVGNKQAKPVILSDNGTEIPCLPNGHQQVASHIHPSVTIFVDGINETIPANIGVTSTCMSEVHTHDASGTVHVETAQLGVEYTINDLFAVLGSDINREGLMHVITIEGEEATNESIMRDNQSIVIEYTSL